MISKEKVIEAIKKHWNIGPAAKELGIGYSTLRKYIKEYGIDHNSRRSQNGSKFDKNAYISKKITELRRRRKIEALEYKGGMKCNRCGFSETIPDVYAFHHRDPNEKDPSWGKMKTNNWKWEKLKEEIDKCDVLCHNCHAIVHYELRNSGN
jgi:DNA-binding transcriptional MerR regulator